MGINFKFTRRNNDDDYEAFGGDGTYYGVDELDDMSAEESEFSMHGEEAPKAPSAAALKIVNPRGYEEAATIADFLLGGNTVLLNIEGLDRANAIRLLDYLAGATRMIGGVMTKVGKTMIVVAPKNVDVSSVEAMVESAE